MRADTCHESLPAPLLLLLYSAPTARKHRADATQRANQQRSQDPHNLTSWLLCGDALRHQQRRKAKKVPSPQPQASANHVHHATTASGAVPAVPTTLFTATAASRARHGIARSRIESWTGANSNSHTPAASAAAAAAAACVRWEPNCATLDSTAGASPATALFRIHAALPPSFSIRLAHGQRGFCLRIRPSSCAGLPGRGSFAGVAATAAECAIEQQHACECCATPTPRAAAGVAGCTLVCAGGTSDEGA